jgi:exonuclease VII large subunit
VNQSSQDASRQVGNFDRVRQSRRSEHRQGGGANNKLPKLEVESPNIDTEVDVRVDVPREQQRQIEQQQRREQQRQIEQQQQREQQHRQVAKPLPRPAPNALRIAKNNYSAKYTSAITVSKNNPIPKGYSAYIMFLFSSQEWISNNKQEDLKLLRQMLNSFGETIGEKKGGYLVLRAYWENCGFK